MKKTITAALAFLAVAQIAVSQNKPVVHMVADAHLDTQWNWTVQTTIDEYVYSTLVQNFKLFEQYPDYIFNFEGAVKYAWAKEYYPQLFETLKKYVAQGRWHISGASWDATDWNLPSIESSIRSILYGQKFYEEEFGIKSTDIMLPDCFGFGWTLPSVASHCGLISFNTQKLQWREKPFYEDGRKFPFPFGIWQGIDGSRIMGILHGGNYSWSPKESIKDWPEYKKNVAASPVGDIFSFYGTGDRGGSPTPEGVAFVEDAVRNPGEAYDVKYSTTDEMAKKYWMDSRLPVHNGELLMDVHGTGCYTSKVEMKNLNRRNEFALAGAETVSAFADLMGGISYPRYEIDNGWKRVIWHQFHDDLTGTSLPDAYRFSYNDEYLTLRQMASVTSSALENIASGMNTAAKGTPVVVYNTVTGENPSTVEVDIPIPEDCKSVEVYSPEGKKVGSQIIRRGRTAKVLFASKDKSMGVSVYDLRPSGRSERSSRNLKAEGNCIENRIYRIRVNGNGDIESIWDKRYGCELVRPGQTFGYDYIEGNYSYIWPSWEILKPVVDKAPVSAASNVKISVEECGSLRAVLKVERTYGESDFVQRIILTDGAADDRIDIRNDVRWWSTKALLKAAFHFNFDAPQAAYDLGMGHVMRGNNVDTAYEVFGRQWADMTAADGSYGVTILNDSRYGWDKPSDNTLRLTLLHTPDVNTRYVYQKTQDLGVHSFTYSIIGHKGALDPVKADLQSDCLNQAKTAFVTSSHEGALGKSLCMASSTNPAIRIKALKKAYDNDGMIVRTYELSGKGASGEVVFPYEILSAEEVNGIEEEPSAASFSGRKLKVDAGAFALKTFRVRLAEPSVRLEKKQCTALELPFNTVGITTDEFATQGRIGDEKFSMAAEILPQSIEHEGVSFTFGKADFANCVRCNAQKIAIPEGTGTLHLLVSSATPRRNSAEFVLDGRTVSRRIGKFTGFYGQYGWPDFYGSYLDNCNVAYIGTHRHAFHRMGNSYCFTYLYMIDLPVDGAKELTLPSNRDIFVYAATACK